MTKTDFIREQTYIKMFTKLILQFKSDRISLVWYSWPLGFFCLLPITNKKIRGVTSTRLEFILPFSWYDSHQTIDGNRTPIDIETIFLFDFWVHIIRIRFLPKAYHKEISNGKLYRVTTPVRTTVPQLRLQQPAILSNHWTSSFIKTCI
jgi:hypothetical protein